MVNKVSLATIAATSIGLTPVAEADGRVEQPEDRSSPPLRSPVPDDEDDDDDDDEGLGDDDDFLRFGAADEESKKEMGSFRREMLHFLRSVHAHGR